VTTGRSRRATVTFAGHPPGGRQRCRRV